MMGRYIILFTFAAFLCQVQSQLCVSPGVVPQIVADTPYVTAPQVVSTTIVDNSVSNALANALQLLIVSDLIESKLGASCLSNVLLGGISPVLETVVPRCATPIEVFPPCAPLIETVIPNYYGFPDPIYSNSYGIAETIIPNYYGGCLEPLIPNPCGVQEIIVPNYPYPYGLTEIVTAPCVPTVYSLPEVVSPVCGCSYYGGVPEVIAPSLYPYGSGVAEIISPSSFVPNYCGVTEVITPINPYNPGCYGEIIAPYNPCGVPEIISPLPPFNPGCGIAEILTPFAPNCYGGITEVISPFAPCNPGCYGGFPDVISVNPYGPYGCIPEIVAPCNTIPEVILPPCSPFYPGVAEIISPVSPCLPSFDFIGPNAFSPPCFNNPFGPVAAEVLIPSAIPAQLSCNFGYLPPASPCVSVNVETLPFDTYGPGFCY